MIRTLRVPDVLLLDADELLEKGEVVQASEKYYKAVEEGSVEKIKSRLKDFKRELEYLLSQI